MKIAQITDIHNNDFLSKSEGLNSLDNLKIILEDIKSRKIKKVVLTGDYGDPKKFDHILREMDNYQLEYEYILGNHDNFDDFKNNKKLENRIKKSGIFFNLKYKDKLFIFLDTRLSYLNDFQLNYLDAMIKENLEEKVVIFTHHPIINCGDTIMDIKYPLENRDIILEKLINTEKEINIFSGHYHANHFVEKKNVRQYVTMSALLQVKKYSADIEIESYNFGYRIIDLENKIESEVIQFIKEK